MRTYKLYASVATSTNGAAYIQMAQACRIRSIRWAVTLDSITDNADANLELSTSTASTLSTNDTVGSFAEVRLKNNFVTSGMCVNGIKAQEFLDLPISAGDRIYANIAITGTATVYATAFIDVE